MFGRLLLLTSLVCLSQAIFFGGGGGGGCCQPSCCQPQQSCSSCCPAPPPPPSCSSCCPPSPSCGCSQSQYVPPPPPPPPQQCSCAQPQPCGYAPQQQQSYAAPQQSCQPRYIIVRPVEHTSQVAGPAPAANYQPSGGESYQSAPAQPAPQVNYQPAPAPIQVPAPQQSSYQGAAAPAPVDTGSYRTGGYKARASKTILLDSRCNSNELRQVLLDNIVADDANESKRRVHKAANEEFIASDEGADKGIDVICAPGAFSYRIATDFFCEQSKGSITCFAYQQHA